MVPTWHTPTNSTSTVQRSASYWAQLLLGFFDTILYMIDFITRAITHPADYLGTLRLQKIELIRREQKSEQIYSFVFKKPEGLTWKAGQHGVFWFFGQTMETGIWRAFSIASSHHENEIRIATIIPDTPSDFKKKLLALTPGDSLHMQGPFGEFHAEGKKHIVGIAGGIGITPFRALAYELFHTQSNQTKLTLIYSATQNLYTFKDELEQWAQSPNIEITYTQTPDEVNQALQNQVQSYGNDAHYFISGSPGMIGALKKACQSMGMTKIVNDPFKGY